jgi:hypothetical protein
MKLSWRRMIGGAGDLPRRANQNFLSSLILISPKNILLRA